MWNMSSKDRNNRQQHTNGQHLRNRRGCHAHGSSSETSPSRQIRPLAVRVAVPQTLDQGSKGLSLFWPGLRTDFRIMLAEEDSGRGHAMVSPFLALLRPSPRIFTCMQVPRGHAAALHHLGIVLKHQLVPLDALRYSMCLSISEYRVHYHLRPDPS